MLQCWVRGWTCQRLCGINTHAEANRIKRGSGILNGGFSSSRPKGATSGAAVSLDAPCEAASNAAFSMVDCDASEESVAIWGSSSLFSALVTAMVCDREVGAYMSGDLVTVRR
jgi:hypothetical protein